MVRPFPKSKVILEKILELKRLFNQRSFERDNYLFIVNLTFGQGFTIGFTINVKVKHLFGEPGSSTSLEVSV